MDIRFRRRTDRRVILIAVLFAATFAEHLAAATRPAGGAKTSGPLVVAANGHARASIVLGKQPADLYKFAASELARYLQTLSGAEFKIISESEVASSPARETLIAIGGAEVNQTSHEAAMALGMKFSGLKQDGFLIKTGRVGSHPVVVVAGNDGPSTMYGVYELIERLGVTFRLTGDIIPPRRDALEIPPLDLRQEPAMSRRGFLVPDAGYENITMFSYEDYAKLIDQMAKMKCNYLQFWWFSYEPWLKYGYKGEMPMLGLKRSRR